MRVAFVGKGGAGKTTLAGLFVSYLQAQKRKVLALDLDINLHLGFTLGIEAPYERRLSIPENQRKIRAFIRGENHRIKHIDHFLSSTPPGRESRMLRLNPLSPPLLDLSTPLPNGGYLCEVGTYESADIGHCCHHASLFIAENILSHLQRQDNEWCVADMVAGTDAFSYALHALFDRIIFVLEPSPHSFKVFQQYEKLAIEAGVSEALVVVGNKIQDSIDLQTVSEKCGSRLIGWVQYSGEFRSARGSSLAAIANELGTPSQIEQAALHSSWSDSKKLDALKKLHLRLAQEQWVKDSCGDIRDQIDPEFSYDIA